MGGCRLDFVVYLGDPDENPEVVPSAEAVKRVDALSGVRAAELYGAVVLAKDGGELGERRPDPIFSLVTNLVRSVPYIIEGEPENILLSESEHGFMFEPSGDDVHVSFFAGDAYEPDEFLIPPETMPVAQWGEQVLSMGERLRDLIQAIDPGGFEQDDYLKSLPEFLEVGREAFKTFQLEVERGLRVL